MANSDDAFTKSTINADDFQVSNTVTQNARPLDAYSYRQLRSRVYNGLNFMEDQSSGDLGAEGAAGGNELGGSGDACEVFSLKPLAAMVDRDGIDNAVSQNYFEPDNTDVPHNPGVLGDGYVPIEVTPSKFLLIKIPIAYTPGCTTYQTSVTPLTSPRDLVDQFEGSDNAAGGDCVPEDDAISVKNNVEGVFGDALHLCELSPPASNSNKDAVALSAKDATNKVSIQDTLEKMRMLERKYRPIRDFLPMHPELVAKRARLIDSFVRHAEFNFMDHDTVYLAVHYLDVFLSRVTIKHDDYQLVGCACLYLACSFENGPFYNSLQDFEPMLKNQYTKAQFRAMRQRIISELEMDLTAATYFMFLRLYASMLTMTTSVTHLAHYLCELALLNPRYNMFYPSVVAAAALALARFNFKRKIWTRRLQTATGYQLQKLQPAILELAKTFQGVGELKVQEIRRKFMSLLFDCISFERPRKMDDAILLKEIERYCQHSRL